MSKKQEIPNIKNIVKHFSKNHFEKLANNFLVETEESYKNKPVWETKNRIPTLHQSINEFYMWLEKNYWKNKS